MLFCAALKSREISDNSAQTAGEVERVRRRWGGAGRGDRGTPSCYDDSKALDSCLLQRAQAANVGAGWKLAPSLARRPNNGGESKGWKREKDF